MLKDKDFIEKSNDKGVVFKIDKKYNIKSFNKYYNIPIDVYLHSINNTIEEYLVNFKYFVDVMKKNNLLLLTEKECKDIGINKSEGLFNELYNDKYNMLDYEKDISFMYRYFIFKKKI